MKGSSRKFIFSFICWHLMISRKGAIMTMNHEKELSRPSGLQQNCDNELGMRSGDIRDDSVTVSSTILGSKYGKENARLNGESAWVTYANDQQWIEIDLGEPKYVSGVKTQGKLMPRNVRLWISEYKVLYKIKPTRSIYQVVTNSGKNTTKIFTGNSDAISVKTNIFPFPIQAQIVRIVPLAWAENTRKIALRLELIGCKIVGRSGCGSPRVMTNPVGHISSMNYPRRYRNNANCRWDIRAPEGSVVALTFLDPFHLESEESNRCSLDYVEVVDDVNSIPKSLGKYCGTTNPGKFISTNNTLKIQFVSDHFESFKGFRAKYSFLNGSGCGGARELRSGEGAVQSINYPGNYINSAFCIWDIQTSQNRLIEIRFSDFHIVGTPNHCNGDSLQIIKFGSTSDGRRSQAAVRLCGHSTPGAILSPSNRLKVIFTSNGAATSKGFRASYQTLLSSGCGSKKVLKDQRGTIQSPNYPEPYANNLHCEWNIIAQSHQDIRLQMRNFHLEPDQNCEYDHVSIYDGKTRRFLLGKYCNEINFQPIVAHSGAMTIVFESDDQNTLQGFEATYEVIPRETVTINIQPSLTKAATIKFSTINDRDKDSTLIINNSLYSTSTQTSNHLTKRNSYTSTNPQTTRGKKSIRKRKEDSNPFVSEELAKWIIIGMISLTGFLVFVIGVGMVLCCKRQIMDGTASAPGSLRNASSGMMQNHAYDFSGASTSQSIRSRQVEDSSQVSESVSHQGTLGREINRESHIYFSIDDYYRKETTTSSPIEVTSESTSSIKVHYSKCRKKENEVGPSFRKDSLGPEQSDIEDEYEDEDEEEEDEDATNDENETEDNKSEEMSSSRKASSEQDKLAPSITPLSSITNREHPKQMVANVLYVSTNKEEE